MPLVEIPIRDDFDNDEGRWRNYDAYNLTQRTAVEQQKHADIRSFVGTSLSVQFVMLFLGIQSATDLEAKTMSDLDGNVIVRASEQWSNTAFNVTVGPQADRNNLDGLVMACDPTQNPNTTQSIISVTS